MTTLAEQARALLEEIEAARPRVTKTLPSLVDINMTAAPLVRQQLAEARRRGVEVVAAFSIGRTAVLSTLSTLEAAAQQHANVRWAIGEMQQRAEAGPERERAAWAAGADYLRDGKGHETPGSVIALRRERGWHNLPTLPQAEARMAEAEADLRRAVDQLRAQLESWRKKATQVA
jgi:hypothetical protein